MKPGEYNIPVLWQPEWMQPSFVIQESIKSEIIRKFRNCLVATNIVYKLFVIPSYWTNIERDKQANTAYFKPKRRILFVGSQVKNWL